MVFLTKGANDIVSYAVIYMYGMDPCNCLKHAVLLVERSVIGLYHLRIN